MTMRSKILEIFNNQKTDSTIAVCFATFDDNLGPISVYQKNLSKDTANEIAMKVMVGSLSLHSENNFELCGESIIPFTKLKKIAFSYLFTIPAPDLRGGVRSSSIIILMNDTQQMVMYRLAPFFSSLCKKISQLIKTKYTFGKNIPFIIKQKLDELLDVNTFQIQYEEFYAARKITVSQAKIKGSLQFLDKIIKRDLDKAILAILTGKKIVVVGDEAMCKIAIASLEIFSPHKELKKVYWTNQIVNADIIGTTKSLAKAYDDAVIVDLFKGKIRGGSSNKFCKNLHSDLKGLTENLVIRKVNERINEIITSASILAELAMKKKVTKKELSSVAPHFNSERMEIITIIAKSINPIFASRIDKLAPYISREASTYDVFA